MISEDPKNIKEYIASYPEAIQKSLNEMYSQIRSFLPKEATEKISWRMPTFVYHGNLIHFAAFKSHLGLYPGADGVAAFEHELKDYHHSKGAIQFPYGEPVPYDLIKKIVDFKVAQADASPKGRKRTTQN
ncbi:MAG: DUF1801 domain-containing protein [Eubacterium sp.]